MEGDKSKKMKKNQSGQTLVALLFFILIGIIATGASAIILFTNLLSEQKVEDSETARQIADSGGESALINLLRNPDYVGETIQVDGGDSVITVTGTTTKTIDVVGTMGDFSRKIEITANYINNVLTITSWQEVY